jgi:histidine triad (HIT) family protein
MQCDLCKTLKEKKLVVFENKNAACILNIHPLVKAHLMIIPKRHVENLSDLTNEERADFLELLGRASKLVQEYMGIDYSFIYIKEGSIKSEPHLHAHVIPAKVPIRHLIAEFLRVPVKKEENTEELIKTKKELQKKLKQL